MTNPRSQSHADLVQELTKYVTASLGHWHGEDDYRLYQKLCPLAFEKLSEETLDLLAEFGRNHGRDAVPEHLGVRGLINADADEKYYVYFALMQPVFAYEEGIALLDDHNSAIIAPICISFDLYEPYIDAIANTVNNSPAARTNYYRALAGVVSALLKTNEKALDYVQILSESEESAKYSIGIEEYTPIGKSPIIRDAALIELVIRNVDRADDIMNYIKSRGVSDEKTLSQYLTDYHPAISKGVL